MSGPAGQLKGRAARLARLMPSGSSTAARTPFVLLVVLLLGGGLITLLLLNSALNEGSFRLSELKKRTTDLTDEEQALQRDVDDHSAPGRTGAAGPRSSAWCPAAVPPSSTRTARSAASPPRPSPSRTRAPAAAPPAGASPSKSAPPPAPPSASATSPAVAATPSPAAPPADVHPRSRHEAQHLGSSARATAYPGTPVLDQSRQVTQCPRRNHRAAGSPAPHAPAAPQPARAAPGPPPAARAGPARPRPAGAVGAPAPPRQPAPPAAPGQPGADARHAGVRRPAAPGPGRRRQRVRRQGREEPLPRRTRSPPSAARSPTAPASLSPPASTRTTSPPTRKMFTPEDSKAPDAPQQAAALLAPILGVDAEELTKKLSTPEVPLHRPGPPPDPTGLEPDQGPQVRLRREGRRRTGRTAAPAANVLAGIFQEPTSKRVYPNGELAAGILGYVNAEGQGAGGLESHAGQGAGGRGRQDHVRPVRRPPGAHRGLQGGARRRPAPTSS